jgi:AraC-like DNA-binding protein
MKRQVKIPLPEQFPLVIREQSQLDCKLHGHNFDELVIIKNGHAVHCTKKDSWKIQAGDVFIIRKGRSHAYRDAENLLLVNILFHLDAMNFPKEELRKLPGYHAFFKIHPDTKGKKRKESRLLLSPEQLITISSIINEIKQETARQVPGYEFIATAHFMRLVAVLSRIYSNLYEKTENPVYKFASLISYIEKKFKQPIAVSTLCERAAMSRNTFFRTFKKITGFSPIHYQLKLRISHATKLLKTGQYSIKEAGFAVGFSDSNYFSRLFKKESGISPRFLLKSCNFKFGL